MKKYFSLLFLIVIGINYIFAWDRQAKYGNLYYNIDISEKTAEVTYPPVDSIYNFSTIDIPSTIECLGKSYTVIGIGMSAFTKSKGLTSVTVPNTVTYIRGRAFNRCTELTSLIIPESVTELYEHSFEMVPNIIYHGEATGAPWGARCVNGYVDGYLVYSDESKTALMASSTAVIGSIYLPNSVTSIANQTFYQCPRLQSVTMSDNVTAIGSHAFYQCDSLISVSIGRATSIENHTFYRCFNLSSITIPNSVTSIGSYAFYGCSSLISVDIPNSVTSVGEYAFCNCTNLSSVVIGDNVTSVGKSAFERCINLPVIDNIRYADTYLIEAVDRTLSSYSIKSGTKWIDQFAFVSCNNLTSFDIPSSIISIGAGVFAACENLLTINVASNNPNYCSVDGILFNKNQTTMIQYASGRKGEYAIPSTVVRIEDYASCSCPGLTAVTIPNSVTYIGEAAFANCPSLTSIEIPESVTTIGNWAFESCPGIMSLTIPNSVTEIGEYAFSNILNIIYYGSAIGSPWGAQCVNGYIDGLFIYKDDAHTQLAACYPTAKGAITIPNTVTTIVSNAFYNCVDITDIVIPSSVDNIINFSFVYCRNLANIYNYAPVPQQIVGHISYREEDAEYYLNKSTCKLYVPAGSIELYRQADEWKDFVNILPLAASGTETNTTIIEPDATSVEISWSQVSGAYSYELVIKDASGNTICTLVFNAQGQLTSITFNAPARENAEQQTQSAGFVFTVNGLEPGTQYNYSIIAKNESGATLKTETGTFTTKSLEGIENVNQQSTIKNKKFLRNGQVLIQKGDHTYTLTGTELK